MDVHQIEKPVGEWTINNAEQIWEQASKGCGLPRRVIDLEKVSDIDTAGIQILALIDHQCRRKGGRLELTNASDSVRSILALYGMDELVKGPTDEL